MNFSPLRLMKSIGISYAGAALLAMFLYSGEFGGEALFMPLILPFYFFPATAIIVFLIYCGLCAVDEANDKNDSTQPLNALGENDKLEIVAYPCSKCGRIRTIESGAYPNFTCEDCKATTD